jgi:hypothetical protein
MAALYFYRQSKGISLRLAQCLRAERACLVLTHSQDNKEQEHIAKRIYSLSQKLQITGNSNGKENGEVLEILFMLFYLHLNCNKSRGLWMATTVWGRRGWSSLFSPSFLKLF